MSVKILTNDKDNLSARDTRVFTEDGHELKDISRIEIDWGADVLREVKLTVALDSIEPAPQEPETSLFDKIAHSDRDMLVVMVDSRYVDLDDLVENTLNEWVVEATDMPLIIDCRTGKQQTSLVRTGYTSTYRIWPRNANVQDTSYCEYKGVLVLEPELLEGEQFWNLINALRTAKKSVILARDEKGGLADLTQSLRCYEPESVIDL